MSAMISVIMSVYNDSAYLSEAIASILNQSFSNFEFLIVDDASTDNSLEIIKNYAKKDNRIRYFQRSENVGLTKNLNFLLGQARGIYVARMDGNDISLQNRFKEQINAIKNNDADLVWSNAILIEESGKEICLRYQPSQKKTLKLMRRRRNYIVHPATMYVKSSILKVGGYDEKYRTGQDGDLWYRMLNNNCSFFIVKQPFIKYRLQKNIITSKRVGKNPDINYLDANTCMRNYQKKKSIAYIKKVKNLRLKTMLIIRLLLNERMLQFIKQLIPIDYDAIHRA